MADPESDLQEMRDALRVSNLAQLNEPATPAPAAAPKNGPPRYLWQGKPWQALQTVAILLSLAINVVLLVVVGLLLLVLGRAFALKDAALAPMVDGLHDGFVAMDNAHIRATIPVSDTLVVNDTLPVKFDLPVQSSTVVTTTQPLLITGASVNINGGVLVIKDAPATILLPANTPLPVELNLTVPVSQTVPVRLEVPVRLTVPVDIPLSTTDLHQPFSDLAHLVAPYQTLVQQLPGSWQEAACGISRLFCLFGP